MLDLPKLYHKYNKLYWLGLLPKDVVVEFSDLIPKGWMEGVHIPEARVPWPRGCGPKPKGYVIRLSPILVVLELHDVAHQTLLHTMVHMEGTLGNRSLFFHGAAFNHRMNELANVGAFDDFW